MRSALSTQNLRSDVYVVFRIDCETTKKEVPCVDTLLRICIFLSAVNCFFVALLFYSVYRGDLQISKQKYLEKKCVNIYVDGACSNNGLPNPSAGWSILVKGDVAYKKAGKLPGAQTSGRAELHAVYEALKWVDEHPEVSATIYSDAKGVVDGILGRCKRASNKDLWEKVEDVFQRVEPRVLSVEKISRDYNNEADKLAKAASRAIFIPEDVA